MSDSDASSPALKEIFNEARYRSLAKELRAIYPAFDAKRFLALTLTDLDTRSLLQRMRRTTEALRETLPPRFPDALKILRQLAPRIQHSFTSIVPPDFVALYGQDHYELSLDALKFFTPFGSAEFAIRTFLKSDLKRTLAVMETWATDKNEHVRRLASEGSRPRLPWSFRLDAIVQNPDLTAPILSRLINDPSLYVRKSVANHLNDISKDHPDWLIAWLRAQDLSQPHARWIAKRALRTLVKRGHPEALALIGATGNAEIKVNHFTVAPRRVQLGEPVTFSFEFTAAGKANQHLVIDYAVHYVKSSGGSSAKVFKWRALDLSPGQTVTLGKTQRIQDFTTRKHFPGDHRVEVMANGRVVAESSFALKA